MTEKSIHTIDLCFMKKYEMCLFEPIQLHELFWLNYRRWNIFTSQKSNELFERKKNASSRYFAEKTGKMNFRSLITRRLFLMCCKRDKTRQNDEVNGASFLFFLFSCKEKPFATTASSDTFSIDCVTNRSDLCRWIFLRILIFCIHKFMPLIKKTELELMYCMLAYGLWNIECTLMHFGRYVSLY